MDNAPELPAFDEAESLYLDEASSRFDAGSYRPNLSESITRWARFAQGVANGSNIELGDLHYFLDKRSTIKEVVDSGPPSLQTKLQPILDKLDAIFFNGTVEAKRPLTAHLSVEAHPWWTRVPRSFQLQDTKDPYIAHGLIDDASS